MQFIKIATMCSTKTYDDTKNDTTKNLLCTLNLLLSLSLSLKAQNQWLRENTVDAHGNLLYCRDCLVACLGVHTSRIQRQRQIKQLQKEQPIVEMTKEEVEDSVLREDEEVLTFPAWWKTVDKDEVVEVQYPHERHGLAGRRSNHAKQEVIAEFLDFVDNNSQPNGRQEGSYSAHFFFLPQFTRIIGPAEREKNFEVSRLLWRSLTGLS